MATLLQNLCVGQYQACLLVMTRLASDCTPLEGPNDQVRTSCFASVDAQPQFDDGAEYGRRSTNGRRCFYVRDCNRFKQIDLTIQIITWDMELIELATGSDVLIGGVGTPFAGKTMGFGLPGAESACPSGVSLEVYTKAAFGTGGFCVSASSGAPTYIRHLFPFARLQMGATTLDDSADGILLNLSGFGLPNPNWGNGPANDWPVNVDLASYTPYAAVFTNTKPESTCGYITAGIPVVPPPEVFNDAVLWLDAASDNFASVSSNNLGTGGVALNAQYGSVAGADTNDPQWLPGGTLNGAYIYFPGVGNNNITVPDAANLDITGDITLVYDITRGATAATGHLGGKYLTYECYMGNTGSISFVFTDGGGTSRVSTSTAAVAAAVNVRGQIAVTKKNGISVDDVKFWARSTDVDPWVQVGLVRSSGGTTIQVTTGQILIGCDPGVTSPLTSMLHQFLVYNTAGAAGEPATTSPVLHINTAANISSESATTFAATTGQTVTIARTASGRKIVTVNATGKARWLLGTDDYLRVPDNSLIDFGLADSFTVMAVRRLWGTSGAALMYKRDGTGTVFWSISANAASQPGYRILDGAIDVNLAGSSTPSSGTAALQTMVRDVGSDLIRGYIGSTANGTLTDTTTATLANTSPLWIGQSGTASPGFSDCEIMMVAVWRRIVSPAELATIATYYGV